MTNSVLGNIVLNPNLKLDDQVKEAIRTHRVSVILYDGSLKANCPVLNFNTTDLVFPTEENKLGSLVLLQYPEGAITPIVIGIIPTMDEINTGVYQNEFQKIFKKETENCSISVSEDALNGNIIVSIFGLKENKSNFKINVGSINNDAQAEIAVQGTLNIRSTNNTNLLVEDEIDVYVRNLVKQDKFTRIKSKLGEGLNITDEFDNIINLDKNGLDITDNFQNNIKTTTDGIEIKDKNENDIKLDSSGITIDVKGDCNLTSSGDLTADVKGNANIKSPKVKLEGGQVQIGNNPLPTQGFTCLTNCVVTGAPHTINIAPSK